MTNGCKHEQNGTATSQKKVSSKPAPGGAPATNELENAKPKKPRK